MQTDEEIIRVVSAHKEGKKIEQRDIDHCELGWRECPFPNWDFYRVEFRVAPEPRKPKDYWLTPMKFGYCRMNSTEPSDYSWHVREVIDGATSTEPTVISDTVRASAETGPRKPREWWAYVKHGEIRSCLTQEPSEGLPSTIRVREVLE